MEIQKERDERREIGRGGGKERRGRRKAGRGGEGKEGV